MSRWRGDLLRGAVLSVVVSLATGIPVSKHYYEKGAEHAESQAVKTAVQEGQARGLNEAQTAFETNIPDLIEERYPGALSYAESSGYAEGFEEGRAEGMREGEEKGRLEAREKAFAEGEEKGFEQGLREGRQAGFVEGQSTATTECEAAYDERIAWTAYSSSVMGLAELAQALEDDRGNDELQNALLSRAAALVEAAEGFRSAYAQKSFSFNGIMNELANALEATNFPRIRNFSLSLRNNLEAKEALFFRAEDVINEVISDLQQ